MNRPGTDVMTPEEVAERLGFTTKLVYAMANRGQIPSVRIGRAVRFRRREFDAWFAGLPMANT